jgi:hypothetical protein
MTACNNRLSQPFRQYLSQRLTGKYFIYLQGSFKRTHRPSLYSTTDIAETVRNPPGGAPPSRRRPPGEPRKQPTQFPGTRRQPAATAARHGEWK